MSEASGPSRVPSPLLRASDRNGRHFHRSLAGDQFSQYLPRMRQSPERVFVDVGDGEYEVFAFERNAQDAGQIARMPYQHEPVRRGIDVLGLRQRERHVFRSLLGVI